MFCIIMIVMIGGHNILDAVTSDNNKLLIIN